MIEGIVLHFRGRTTSPFHTSRQEYANLLKCAPFIMGCTFRGAVLDYLIRTLCKQALLDRLRAMDDPRAIADFHRACAETCSVKLFFAEKPLVWFSFAEFEGADYQTVTRIGVARDTRSVAEGSIFNVETIAPGAEFTFEIFLFGPAQKLEAVVVDTVEQVGLLRGVGRGRSIGFGLFEILDQWPEEFERRLAEEIGRWPQQNGKLRIVFKTPFVLGELAEPTALQGDRLSQHVPEQICAVASTIQDREMQPMAVERVDVRIRPEFVGRFSYERGLRENRLVAWPGSSFVLHLSGEEDTDQLALAAVLGIGPWNDWGFGRFHLS